MTDTQKKALIIVLVVLAVVGGGYSAFHSMKSDQPEVVRNLGGGGPGTKSPKQLEVEAQARDRASRGTGQPPAFGTTGPKERDIGDVGAPPKN